MFRRLAALIAALTITALATATVVAATAQLHQGTNIAWNDPGVEVECDEQSSVPSGMVLWHFVTHATTSDFTMTASFTDLSFNVVNKAADKVLDSYELHWDVLTSLTTLESASITGSGTVNPGGFNLSHVCPNPGEEIPEAPASVLLVASAAILGIGFVGWKRRGATLAA